MDRPRMPRPNGPLPPSVYWLRRAAIALVGIGVLVLVVVLVLRAIPAGSSTAAPKPSPTGAGASNPPSAPGTSGASNPPGATATTAPTTSAPTVTPSPTATAATACTAADIATLTVTTTDRTYPAGSEPTFTAVVVPRTPCTAATPTFEVTSGRERIWDSADCAATRTTLELDARTGAVSERWDLKRSAPACATVFGTTTATAGTYHVVATVAGVTSTPVPFALS